MRLQGALLEIGRAAAVEKIKFSGGAALLLVLSIFGAAAQSGKTPPETPSINPTIQSPRDQTDATRQMTLTEAIDLALKQVSAFRGAEIGEQIAAEDVRLAKAALYPRIALNPSIIYTSPSFSRTTAAGVTPAGNLTSVTTRPPSFLGANAITEYQGVANVAGEIDISGRLRATIKRSQALLESAKAGTEIARRDLIQAVSDAYFNLALATTLRRGAEMNLQSATEFENNTKLLLDAGEVAPVDLVRARLQAATRRDELAQAQASESVLADSLRSLVGFDFTAPIAIEDLLTTVPADDEIERYTETATKTRPEFAQFEADFRAAEQDIKIARAERRPQITYSVNGGFISDSLAPGSLKNSLGIQPSVGVSIPLFDKGASKSREAQARLRIWQAQNARALAERQFAQAFFSARTQAVSARSRVRQIAASITDAEANVAASMARYRAGEASIIEVTDANNNLILQRQAFYQAIFDYQTARTRLLRAIGQ